MRHSEPKNTSSEKGRNLLEKILKERRCSLYNLALDLGVSETSLRKYRKGLEQGSATNSKISASLKVLCPPASMPS